MDVKYPGTNLSPQRLQYAVPPPRPIRPTLGSVLGVRPQRGGAIQEIVAAARSRYTPGSGRAAWQAAISAAAAARPRAPAPTAQDIYQKQRQSAARRSAGKNDPAYQSGRLVSALKTLNRSGRRLAEVGDNAQRGVAVAALSFLSAVKQSTGTNLTDTSRIARRPKLRDLVPGSNEYNARRLANQRAYMRRRQVKTSAYVARGPGGYGPPAVEPGVYYPGAAGNGPLTSSDGFGNRLPQSEYRGPVF